MLARNWPDELEPARAGAHPLTARLGAAEVVLLDAIADALHRVDASLNLIEVVLGLAGGHELVNREHGVVLNPQAADPVDRAKNLKLAPPTVDGRRAPGGRTGLRDQPRTTVQWCVFVRVFVVCSFVSLSIAFALRSARAERYAGLAVVLAIFVSACVAGYEAVDRLIDPRDVEHLGALAIAGAVGFAGNWIAAIIRSRAGRRLDSPALVADGAHARADAYLSLGVIASAAAIAAGLEVADPLIGLAITIVILRITWDSWRTVRGRDQHREH